MSNDLSERQRNILEYIQQYYSNHTYAPSFREIAAHVGLKNASGVWHHINKLEELGYLTRDALIPRTLMISSENSCVPKVITNWLPVYRNEFDETNKSSTQKIISYFPTNETETAEAGCFGFINPDDTFKEEFDLRSGDLLIVYPRFLNQNGQLSVIKRDGGLMITKTIDIQSQDEIGVISALLRKI